MIDVFSQGLGIDLGTANTLIYEKGKGICLNEPSVVAIRPTTGEVVAVGLDAKQMLGKTPGEISAIRPLREGVIADFDITQVMLRFFMKKVMDQRVKIFKHPRVVICVPCGITDVEKRAVEEAARSAGAREILLMDEPMAAAIGAGLDVTEPRGRMILDIGGGTSEVAVISLGGIVEHRSLRVGGNYMDSCISDYVRNKYNVFIGDSTAEYVKIKLGSAIETEEEQEITVRGRSLISGLPTAITISQPEVRDALKESVERILAAVRQTLENTPPELSADISEEGIVMTGGTSKLKGLDLLIQMQTGVPVRLAKQPLTTVAEGAGLAVERMMEDPGYRYAMRSEA